MYSAKELAIARLIKPDIEVAQLDVTDLAVLQLVRKATGGGSGVYNATIENGIATFGGVVASSPLVSLLLNLPILQTGSGTSSPDNVRDFIGVSGVNIGQISNGQYASAFKGLLAGTHGFVDLGDLEWKYTSATTRFYTNDITDISLDTGFTDMLCSGYNVISSAVLFSNMPDKSIKRGQSSSQISIRDLDYTDADVFTTAVSGVYLIYELETPTTPTITPQDFATLCQAFGITGNIYTISFGQTVYSAILNVLNGKLYLIDEIKTIDENSGVTRATTNVFYLPDFFDVENDTESINCNIYDRGENKSTGGGVVSNPDYSFCCSTTSNQLYIKDVRFNTITDYNDYLANNPVKIAVKLAEPIEIDITPTVINTLIGENVIFADVANVTECKYTRK